MMSCYYSTTVIAIDDDESFLRTIGQHLAIAKDNLYHSPQLAMQKISKQDPYERIKSRLLKSSNLISDDADITPDNYSVTINPHRLHEEIYSEARFKDVSVLIVDYHMGDISGVDFCKQLSSHPAKKILLTGGIDNESVIIEAFNQELIHRFINKSDKNFITHLQQAIHSLQDMYFKDMSLRLMPHIPSESATVLHNRSYINFVNNLVAQINAVEYYLLDMLGSLLLLDIQGNLTWVNIKSEAELSDLETLALNDDEACEIASELKLRKKIPFFFSEEDYQQPIANWLQYFHDAMPLPGIPGHFYSIIRGNIGNNLSLNAIVPHTRYHESIGFELES